MTNVQSRQPDNVVGPPSSGTIKAVIYQRVSTDKQHVENQDIIVNVAQNRGWEVVRIYQEKESAWKDGHQYELSRLIADSQRGEFQIVLVWALDRLCREGALATLKLFHRLNLYGVKIVSFMEPWTEAPGEIGEVLIAMVAWVARMESARRSDRTKAGMERAKREGKHIGRPKGRTDTKKRKKRIRK